MRRTLIAVALASSLGIPSPARLLDSFWSLLSSLGQGAPITKEGCGMDPNGRCKPAQTHPLPQADAGCGADPDGRCKPAPVQPLPQSDAGCGADPSGHPKCS